ncbi:hypothetical protein KJ951_04800 [Patescibacteria group bacterium]|nr:hypothetical protein [Patescibacteria group bacterium]MBU1703695.1 hypothetical protein [Patescibacteria group bacterium]MBU1953511.1 hypothetical protein [Patescibacteria group bacterium]
MKMKRKTLIIIATAILLAAVAGISIYFNSGELFQGRFYGNIKFATSDRQMPAPTISNVKVSNNPFDPYAQNTTISYDLNYSAETEVFITAPNYKKLYLSDAGKQETAGTHTKTWDGRDPMQNEYPEGNHPFTITASNASGTTAYTGNIKIEYTPAPTISNVKVSNNPFDPYTQNTTISYDLNYSAETAIYITAPNYKEFYLSDAGKQETPGTHAKRWDGRDPMNKAYPEGNHPFTITASNASGTTTYTGNIKIEYAPAPIISNVKVSNNPFDPYAQNTTISYDLNYSAETEVFITAPNYKKLYLSDAGKQETAGTHTKTWDGRDPMDKAYPEGNHPFTITASNSGGTSTYAGTIEIKFAN